MDGKQKKRVKWLIGLVITVYVLLNLLYFLEEGEPDWQYFSVAVFGAIFLILEVRSLIIKFRDIQPLKERISDKWNERNNFIPDKFGQTYIGFTEHIAKLKSELYEYQETERSIYYGKQALKIIALVLGIWMFFEYHNFYKDALPVTNSQLKNSKKELYDSINQLETKIFILEGTVESLMNDLDRVDAHSERLFEIEQNINNIEEYVSDSINAHN